MHRAIRQLPHHIAMALILTGDRIDAQQAERYGLVNEVVPYEKLLETGLSWAERIASASPLAVQAAKDAVLSRAGWPLDVVLHQVVEIGPAGDTARRGIGHHLLHGLLELRDAPIVERSHGAAPERSCRTDSMAATMLR